MLGSCLPIKVFLTARTLGHITDHLVRHLKNKQQTPSCLLLSSLEISLSMTCTPFFFCSLSGHHSSAVPFSWGLPCRDPTHSYAHAFLCALCSLLRMKWLILFETALLAQLSASSLSISYWEIIPCSERAFCVQLIHISPLSHHTDDTHLIPYHTSHRWYIRPHPLSHFTQVYFVRLTLIKLA